MTAKETPTFGGQLRSIRKRRGMSLQTAASKSKGLSDSGLLRIERGARTNPQMTTLMAIARSLNITIEIGPDSISITDLGPPKSG